MTDFVTVEMAFHAKALEVYSQCFQNLSYLSIDADIKVSEPLLDSTNNTVKPVLSDHLFRCHGNRY